MVQDRKVCLCVCVCEAMAGVDIEYMQAQTPYLSLEFLGDRIYFVAN